MTNLTTVDNNKEFLLAFVCDHNPIINNSQNLYQIVKLITVVLSPTCPFQERKTISIDDLSSDKTIFGLDDKFYRERGKKIYVTMDNIDSTIVYFNDEQWNIHSDVPKLFMDEDIEHLDCSVVKFYFTNLIIGKFDFIIHYNFKENYYIPIFDHYDLFYGNDIGILNNTKYKIKCIGYAYRNPKDCLYDILSCLDISFTEQDSYTLFGNYIALITGVNNENLPKDICVPSGYKVVYIYSNSKKLTLKRLVLPQSVEHILHEGIYSFALNGITIFISKNTNINNLFGNISKISNVNKLKQYTGIDIEEY